MNQTLLDLSEPTLRRITCAAPSTARVMVSSGDVFVRAEGELPSIPEADVVLIGLWTTPEEVTHFGVLFCSPDQPDRLQTFFQKPSPDTIREKSREHAFLIGVGIWLLSERAVECLMFKSGWDTKSQAFFGGLPDTYDLYGRWALHLGEAPLEIDTEVSLLTTAVVPLLSAESYHFGTSEEMLESVYALQNLVSDQTKLEPVATRAQPRQFLQNAIFRAPLHRESHHSLWGENICIPSTWSLAERNILTGVPDNDWLVELEDGVCLDFVPIGNGSIVLRAYG